MKHRDFVVLVRGEEHINALVASSNVVTTPATQTVPASSVEHLTLVYLDPAAGESTQQTGEALRNSIKVQIDVPPADVGKHFGWMDPAGANEAEYAPSTASTGVYGVPMAQLIELSHRIQSHAADLEISPDAVVPSACTLIDGLVKDRDQLAGLVLGSHAPIGVKTDDTSVRSADSAPTLDGIGDQSNIASRTVDFSEVHAKLAAEGIVPEPPPIVDHPLVPAEEVVQADPAIAEAVDKPTE